MRFSALLLAVSSVCVLALLGGLWNEAVPLPSTTTHAEARAAAPTKTRTKTKTKTKTRTKTKTKTRTKTRTATRTTTGTATSTSTATPTSTLTSTPTITKTPNPLAGSNTVLNGGFEDATGWALANAGTRTMATGGVSPAHGDWMFKVVVSGENFGQIVVVPADATTLKYSYRYENAGATCGSELIYFYDDNFAFNHDGIEMCTANYSSSWRTVSIDVTALRGTTVNITYTIFLEPGTIVYLDDVGFVTSPETVVDYY